MSVKQGPAHAGWEQIKVGDEAQFEVTLTPELVAQFAAITGDDNRLHMDEDFARSKGFGGRVVHGLLLASFFSRLVGKHFLGDDNLYLSQEVNFKKPVMVGETVVVRGIVKEKIESAKMLIIITTIELNGETVVVGEAKVTLGVIPSEVEGSL